MKVRTPEVGAGEIGAGKIAALEVQAGEIAAWAVALDAGDKVRPLVGLRSRAGQDERQPHRGASGGNIHVGSIVQGCRPDVNCRHEHHPAVDH
jgi:hypothetical protein